MTHSSNPFLKTPDETQPASASRARQPTVPSLDAQPLESASAPVPPSPSAFPVGFEAELSSDPFAAWSPTPPAQPPAEGAAAPSTPRSSGHTRWASLRAGILWFSVGLLGTWQALAIVTPGPSAPAATSSTGSANEASPAEPRVAQAAPQAPTATRAAAQPESEPEPAPDADDPRLAATADSAEPSAPLEAEDTRQEAPPQPTRSSRTAAANRRAPAQTTRAAKSPARSTAAATPKPKPKATPAPAASKRTSTLSLERSNPWQ